MYFTDMSQLSFVDDFPRQGAFANGHIDDFTRLSDELLLNIFSYLSKADLNKCGLTCRRLRHLSLDESLWKRLDLGGKAISGELLHRLLGRGIQYLRLAKANIRGRYWPNPPPRTPCRLRYLDLSMVDGDDPIVIYEILSCCNELIAVSLENCWVNDLSCKALATNTDLKILNLSAARELSTFGMQLILTGCRWLEELNVAWTKLDQETVTLVVSTAPESLLRLNLAGCRDNLFDGDIATLCASCPNLTELDISDASELTLLAMEAAAESLLRLRVLGCSRCYKIDPLAYTILLPRLKELNVFNSIDEPSWPAFKRLLPGLSLNVSLYSTIARPTVGIRRTSIWGHRVRDE